MRLVALYEYRCAQGHSTEIFHRMDETPSVLCDDCGSKAERVLSMPMIHTQYYFSPQVAGRQPPAAQAPSETVPTDGLLAQARARRAKSSAEKPSGKKSVPEADLREEVLAVS